MQSERIKKIRIGTRSSNLALKQVEEIINLLPENIETEIKKIDTSCDKDKITPISEIEGTDFFTDSIDNALLNDEIDIAVHSAKDLPDKIKNNLLVIAITKSISNYDVLVSKNNLKLDQLPKGAKIGVSSKRRKENIKNYRPDLKIVDIRGNIEERLSLVEEGKLDAVIVAEAALIRLGLKEKISERLPLEKFDTHPLQGSLAIVSKFDREEFISFFTPFDIRKKVLFICIENSCRSQIAETLTNHIYWNKFFAYSAGSKPSGIVNPNAIEVLKERGIDISNRKSKGFENIPKELKFDYVITMGCGDECPFYPGAKRIEWQIPDPKGKSLEFFRETLNLIEEKIKNFIQEVKI